MNIWKHLHILVMNKAKKKQPLSLNVVNVSGGAELVKKRNCRRENEEKKAMNATKYGKDSWTSNAIR